VGKRVKSFKNIKEIVELLRKENSLYGDALRFNWRLVFLPDYKSLRKFFNEVSSYPEFFEVLHLENYTRKGKKWLDGKDLIENILKQIRSKKNAVLFSLDSVLRFFSNDDLKNFFQVKLCTLENLRVNKLLILPICGMEERVLPFLSQCPRFAEGLLPALYVLLSENQEKVELFLINEDNIPDGLKTINSLKEFLELWKEEKERKYLVSLSSILGRSENPQPDSAVTVRKLESKEELLQYYFGFKEKIYFKNEKFIDELVKEVSKKKATNWGELLDQVPETLETFFKELPELKGYEAWKFVNSACSVLEENSEVVKETLEESLRALYSSKIVSVREKLRILKLLKGFHPSVFNRLCSALGALVENLELNLSFLPCEKEVLLKYFSEGKISLKELKERFKEVYHYLRELRPENCHEEWIYSYFKLYRIGKLKNSFPEKLRKVLEEVNRDYASFSSWYYSFPTVKEVAKDYKNIFLLDCVGAEWLPYLLSLLQELGYSIKKVILARSELPSTTEFNKIENAKVIEDFDRLVHEKFNFPKSIIEQFELLKELLQSKLPSNESFVITSDHGATTFSRFADSLNLCSKPKYSGRYCEDEIETAYGFNFNGFTCAKFHNSLGKRPVSEVHGGTTPEEVLVPFIVIGKKEKGYDVNLITKKVGRGEELVLSFEPNVPERIKLLLGNKELNFSIKQDKIFVQVPFNIRAGEYELKIILGPEEKKFKFRITGGIEEEDIL
jgi:hypothetical protein